jgi:transcriptional regulator with XRE-family HTH domain
MNDVEKQQRFVFLRAEGWSFARIAEDLGVSKPTLIQWSRKFRFEIQNQRAILLEHLKEQWVASLDQRVTTLGEQLRQVEAELTKRDVTTLTTGQLFTLACALRRQINQEIGDLKFTTPVADIPGDEFVEEVQDWKP